MKKIYLVFLLGMIVLLTGCPKSTPKQPTAFNRLDGNREEYLTKFDNELAKYNTSHSIPNHKTVLVSLDPPVQVQIGNDIKNILVHRIPKSPKVAKK